MLLAKLYKNTDVYLTGARPVLACLNVVQVGTSLLVVFPFVVLVRVKTCDNFPVMV